LRKTKWDLHARFITSTKIRGLGISAYSIISGEVF
jgi:hypothetical protein